MIKKVILSGAFMMALMLTFVAPAGAATTYTLFGDASVVAAGNPGNAAELTSDDGSFGGVSITPSAPIAWADLDTLSLDFNVTDDSCGGGSPRVQIRVDTNNDGISNGNVHVALGPSPSFTGCTSGWQSSGNLIGNADAGRYDYSQFGGSPFTTYSNAPASVTGGQVVGISVVVDGSWHAGATGGDGEQTTLADNIAVNSDVTTFEPTTPQAKNECKNGGWMTFTDPAFKNQGQCVSYFEKNN